ncbi:MAG: hypothetical protein ACHP7N_17910 [Caulobacterales bacterium]
MNVEIATERIIVIADRFSGEIARAKAWALRIEAFGTMAKLGGFLSRPKDEEFEVVYSERRLQPFWRIASLATAAYERGRDYQIALAPEVQSVLIDGEARAIAGHKITLHGHESCREETRRQVLVDGLTGEEDLGLAAYLEFAGAEADAERLAALAKDQTVIVPPKVKASGLVRDAVSKALGKIDADKVLEETVRLEAVDLYYRPVYAFRYRRAGKEAVVEFDAVTGEPSAAGSTFEQHLGKIMEPRFLLDIGAEAANIFIPGATVAKLALVKGLELHEKHKAAKAP